MTTAAELPQTESAVPPSPESAPRSALPYALARQHPALVLSLVTGAAVVGKVLLAARGDVGVALALVTAGIPSVLLGVAVLYSPVLSLFLAIGAFWWRLRERSLASATAVSAGSIAAAYVLPIITIVVLLTITATVVLTWRRSPVTRAAIARLGEWMEWDRAKLLDWALYFLLAGLVFSPAVWVPREKIEVAPIGVFTGYVIEEDGPWITLLREDSRTVLRTRPAALIGREVCDAEPGLRWLSLPQLFNPPASLPACPPS